MKVNENTKVQSRQVVLTKQESELVLIEAARKELREHFAPKPCPKIIAENIDINQYREIVITFFLESA